MSNPGMDTPTPELSAGLGARKPEPLCVKDVFRVSARYPTFGVYQNIGYVIASCAGGCLRIDGVPRSALPLVTSNLNVPEIALRIE